MPRGGKRDGAGRPRGTRKNAARTIPVAFRMSEQVAGEVLERAEEGESLGEAARRLLEEAIERVRENCGEVAGR